MNAVPQRTWMRLIALTASGSSGTPRSHALIALCSAEWYWNTRLHVGHQPDRASGSTQKIANLIERLDEDEAPSRPGRSAGSVDEGHRARP